MQLCQISTHWEQDRESVDARRPMGIPYPEIGGGAKGCLLLQYAHPLVESCKDHGLAWSEAGAPLCEGTLPPEAS